MFTSLDLPSWLIWTVILGLVLILCVAIIPWLKRYLQEHSPDSERRRLQPSSQTNERSYSSRASPAIGLEARHTDRDRAEIKIRSSDLIEFEALVSKLVCSINDAGHQLSKSFNEAATRANVDRSFEMLGRRFETASERSAEQILYAIGDLGDEIRKLTQAVRDMSSLLRDTRIEPNKQPGLPGAEAPRQHALPAAGPTPMSAHRAPLEFETKPATRTPEPVEKVVMARFDELDRATNRNFASLKSEFRQSLGDRVSDICLQDDAVLFYTSPERAIVHPWRNVPLNRAWHPYFDLRGRSNVPIRKVNRPAVIIRRDEGGWTSETMGDIENAD